MASRPGHWRHTGAGIRQHAQRSALRHDDHPRGCCHATCPRLSRPPPPQQRRPSPPMFRSSLRTTARRHHNLPPDVQHMAPASMNIIAIIRVSAESRGCELIAESPKSRQPMPRSRLATRRPNTVPPTLSARTSPNGTIFDVCREMKDWRIRAILSGVRIPPPIFKEFIY